ncbi:MAG: transposase [Thermogutta sp.]
MKTHRTDPLGILARKPMGRGTVDWRKALNGGIFRVRTGCQWNKLPKQFGDASTVHPAFQRWCRDGVMAKI